MANSYNIISQPEQLNDFTTIIPVHPVNVKIPNSYTFPFDISNELDKLDPDFKFNHDVNIGFSPPNRNKTVYSYEVLEKIEKQAEELLSKNTIPIYGKPEYAQDCK